MLAACSSEDLAEDVDRFGQVDNPIINGQVDSSHPAVVAYSHNGGICSATIIEVQGNLGYALTAAHCIGANNGELSVGTNTSAPDAKIPVVARAAHPDYGKTALYDVAMLVFEGANGSTPTLSLLEPSLDKLKAGSPLEILGYGRTEDGGGTVGVRHTKAMTAKAVTSLRIIYDQTKGGMCSGDSGGPSLTTAAPQRVAGVHSFVASNDGSCLYEGHDMRVSAFVDSFIRPFIDETPYGLQTCDQCTEAHTFNGICTPDVEACYASPACSSYVSCIQSCNKAGCYVECEQKFPLGATLYDAIYQCVCDSGCNVECADAGFCNPPVCGLTAAKPSCNACLETSCCSEAQACSNSPTCVDCLSSLIPGPSCDSDPATAQYEACLAAQCPDACGITTSSSASSTTGDGSGGGSEGGGSGAGGASSSVSTTSGAGLGGPGDVVEETSSCSAAGNRGISTSGVANGGLACLAAVLGLSWSRRRRSFRSAANLRSE